MHPISAIIVAKGNPPHISETLDSIKDFVSEIIIADIGMHKHTKSGLSKYNVKFIEINEPVPYVELIREKLKTHASQPYVLVLDPDEVISQGLKNEWLQNLEQYDYFVTPRKNIIFGRWIAHSRWWPDYQIRLFKKNAVVWPVVIHKQPVTSGKEYKVKTDESLAIIHHNYETIDEYLTKAMRYAKSESSNLLSLNRTLTFQTSIKNAVSEFISRYFSHEGYKDGIHGFMLAFFQMMYPLLVYFYYLEADKFSSGPSEKELMDTGVSLPQQLYKESLYWKGRKASITLKEKVLEKLIDQ